VNKKKKSLNLVITTSLIIIISVSLLIAFQIWSQALIKNLGKTTSSLTNMPFIPNLLSVENGEVKLYINSKVDATGVAIKVKKDDQVLCQTIVNLKRGNNEVTLSGCENKVFTGETYQVLLINEQTTQSFDLIAT
jgi:hypothetical protein